MSKIAFVFPGQGTHYVGMGMELADRYPEASAVFATLTGNNRFAVLYRTSTPRTPQGRARAVERMVAALARGEVPYPPRGAGDRNGPA